MLFVRPSPEFRWHPHSNSALFSRYPETTSYDLQYDGGPANRIIAPIPDKSKGLEGVFMKAVNEKAKETARLANHIVAIGYSFNVHDRKSYEPILKALATRIRLTIISPDAEQSAERLRTEFKNLEVVARASTFKQWADTSFPL